MTALVIDRLTVFLRKIKTFFPLSRKRSVLVIIDNKQIFGRIASSEIVENDRNIIRSKLNVESLK